VSEPMTDLDWWAATRYPSTDDDWTPSPRAGRHAFDEDAAETPIFHALTTGAWRSRRPAEQPVPAARPPAARRPGPDAVEAFRRDPLTMPIPARSGTATEVARRAAFGAHALRSERHEQPPHPREHPGAREQHGRRDVSDSGRHHRTRPSISTLL
jgi:hypothetical protein